MTCDNFWADERYNSLRSAQIAAWIAAWLLFGGETNIIDTELPLHD